MLMVFRHVYNLGHGNASISLPLRRVGRISWTLHLGRLARPDFQCAQQVRRWISSSSIIHDSTQRPASRNANTPARRFPSLQEQATRCYTQPSASCLEQNKPTQPHDELHTQNDHLSSSSSPFPDTVQSKPQPPSRPSSPFKPPSSAALDPSSSHHDLPSFLAHAARTGLSPTSTVYTGTLYEYSTSTTLRNYGFDLHRVGGRGDRGVDLIGLWHIPRLASRTGSSTGEWKEHTNPSTGETAVETDTFRVLVQCKRLVGKHAKIGPNLVRELDGAVRGARLGALFDRVFGQNESQTQTPEAVDGSEEMERSRGMAGPTIGVLVGTRPATKGVIEGMRRSSRALVWIMMEEAQAVPLNRGHSFNEDTENEAVAIEATPSSSPGSSLSDETPPASDSAAESASTTEADPDPTSSHAASLPHAIPDSNSNGCVKQILWNQAARNLGLEDVNVVSRYDTSGREEVVLMRGGRVWGGS
ncbi:hypothetical protein LTS15_007411 [Exophiala xenobiotica]|nr:hypothetical protein LTS15_007411 [Exophiala xenobiotica]